MTDPTTSNPAPARLNQTHPAVNFSAQNLSEAELLHHAENVATLLPRYGLVAFWGDLGVGKTTFIRRLIQTLSKDPHLVVPSPTFNLIQEYSLGDSGMAQGTADQGPTRQTLTNVTLWHCDLYRLTCPDECLELGLLEAMHSHLCLIEWPDRMGSYLPKGRIDIHIDICADDLRKIVVKTPIA